MFPLQKFTFCSVSLLQTGTGEWTADGVMERSVQWVSQVWQQLNACLSRLGTHEALLGPQLFLSCPLLPNNTQAVVRCVHLKLFNIQITLIFKLHGKELGNLTLQDKELYGHCIL